MYLDREDTREIVEINKRAINKPCVVLTPKYYYHAVIAEVIDAETFLVSPTKGDAREVSIFDIRYYN